MAKNSKYTQLDWNQALKNCIDEGNDSLRIVVINPEQVDKKEIDSNLKELINVLKSKEQQPLDKTNFSVLEKNIEKLSASIKEEKAISPDAQKVPNWIKFVLIVQTLCLIGLVVSSIIKH